MVELHAQRAADIMTAPVETVRPDTSVAAAAKLMAELDIGALPVTDGTRLIGLVTDRDIAVRAVAAGLAPASTPVEQVMTRDPEHCLDDEAVSDVAEKMRALQIRRLPVVDSDKQLVGIIALGDLALTAVDSAEVGETLAGISEPSQPVR